MRLHPAPSPHVQCNYDLITQGRRQNAEFQLKFLIRKFNMSFLLMIKF
jgi:hypothetical protein